MKSKLSQLDFLEEMFLRDLIDPQSEAYQHYVWQSQGASGEKECLAWLKEALPAGCLIFPDLELELNGRTQVDLLVLADDVWWVIEVKNYRGVFSYQNYSCEINGFPMQTDQIASMRKRMNIMKELAHKIDPSLQVIGTMIFIHPEGEAHVERQEDFSIVMRHQLNRHIQEVRNRFKLQRNQLVNSYLQSIMKHYSPYPVILPALTDADWTKMRKGCRCPHCNSYRLEICKKSLLCLDCGHRATKTVYAEDLYCQLCVLSHNNDEITISKLEEFGGGQISDSTLRRSLYNKIEKRNNYRNSCLYNHKLPRHKMDHILGLKQTK